MAPAQSRSIRVATDCSGMEAPIQAFNNMGVVFEHVMSCDILPAARVTIEANFPDSKMYEDITTRNHKEAPDCDFYIAGFPCQPFSTAGLQQGFKDTKKRGTIFFHCRDFIKAKLPKIFILENVSGLAKRNMADYNEAILEGLHNLKKYNIYCSLLDTKNHGIPQSRSRFYIVGIRKDVDKGTFEWPQKITMPEIENFLEPLSEKDNLNAVPPTSQGTALANVQQALMILESKKPLETTFIVDCDSSPSRSKAVLGYSPCITRSRSAGHWITSRGRRMTKEEMMRLQGMNPTLFNLAISPMQLGQQIGNSMSLNVLERLFTRLLPAAGLSGRLVDRWETGEALEVLKNSRGKTFKSVVPPTRNRGPTGVKRTIAKR